MRARLAGAFFGILTLVASQATNPGEKADTADFEKVCGACHTTDMASDLRAKSEWEETIERMVAVGAKGTDQQMEAVMRVLLRTRTKVNINTADAGDLPLVLEIPKSTADAVVKYRAAHGNFRTLDDLKKVPGIDGAKIEALKDRVAF
jgi:competence protein ComEA